MGRNYDILNMESRIDEKIRYYESMIVNIDKILTSQQELCGKERIDLNNERDLYVGFVNQLKHQVVQQTST